MTTQTTGASKAVWNSGAGAYATQAEQVSFYPATNKALLNLVTITPAMHVLDLACGASSLIIRSLLGQADPPRVLVGVDMSEEMIREAQTYFAGSNARFVVAKAEDVAGAVDTTFDAIFCNSALFLTDVPRTLRGVRSILTPTGSFMFSLAEWQTGDPRAAQHPKYEAINAELRARGLPEKTQRGQREKVSPDGMDAILSEGGLRLAQRVDLDVVVPVDDWKRFYAIDSFAMMSLPHLPLDVAKDALAGAMKRLEDKPLPDVRWYIYRAVLA